MPQHDDPQTEAGHDGPDPNKCGGKLLKRPGWCTQAKGWGTDHAGIGRCKLHGGSTPNHRKAAARELAKRAVETYGLPRVVEPEMALLELVWATAGHVDWLRRVVAEMEQDELVWGESEHRAGSGPEGPVDITTHKAATAVMVQLYQWERNQLRMVCRDALAGGVAERQVRLAESQGALLADVLRGVLGELGVLDLPGTAEVVRRHLMAMSAIETGGAVS